MTPTYPLITLTLAVLRTACALLVVPGTTACVVVFNDGRVAAAFVNNGPKAVRAAEALGVCVWRVAANNIEDAVEDCIESLNE